MVDFALLEDCLREDLNKHAPRDGRAAPAQAWSSTTIPDDQVEEMDAVNNPEDASAGTRKVPFSKVLYIEQDDFHGRPAEEILPPGPRPRGAPALRLFHHLHGRGQGR